MTSGDTLGLKSNPKDPWRGRPWVYLALALAVTFAVWRLAAYEKHGSVTRMTRVASVSIVADLTSDLKARTRALEHLLDRWRTGAVPSEADWGSEFTHQIDTFPGYRRFEWLDPSFRVRRNFLIGGTDAEAMPDPDFEARRMAAIEAARDNHELTFSPSLALPRGEKGFMICVPMYRDERLDGFIVATLCYRELFEDVLKDHAGLGYKTAINEGNYKILDSGEQDNHEREYTEQDAKIQFPGVTWQVHVWPGAELLAEMNSGSNATIVLLAGFAFSLLLKITADHALTASRLANKIGLANQQLEGEIAERKRTEAALLASRARLAGILEVAPESVISINEKYEITLFNSGAEHTYGYRAAEVLGKPLELLIPERYRANHRQFVQKFADSDEAVMPMGARQRVIGLRRDGLEFPAHGSISKLVLEGEKVFTVVLRDISEAVAAEEALRKAHDELEQRVQERTIELAQANEALRAEISERRLAEDSLELLSGHLLNLQDEERRRIARELHDSTAQTLAAITIGINTVQLESSGLSEAARNALTSSAASTEECLREIRNLSYLLHPPLLDGFGLTVALDSFATGFSKRSGIRVDLVVPPDFVRLPIEVELAFFRIVQESLTNVYRYSGSPTVTIRLSAVGNGVTLEVSDHGRGIPGDVLEQGAGIQKIGVGIAGMRARMKQLGGQLEIKSGPSGTTIRAALIRPGSDA